MTDPIRVGCSGWVYKHWRGLFYPEEMPQKRWFEHYVAHFDTVEINNSFYRLPAASTFDGWREQAPDGFCYAVKANRFITQAKKLKDCEEPLDRFLKPTRRLRDHLGPILFQLPPRFRLNLERLEIFLRSLPDDLTYVFEFRDRSWLVDQTLALLDKFGAGFVAHDLPEFETPDLACGKAAYVRFHGTKGKYRGRYSSKQIARWAEWLRDQRRKRRTCWAYFNNDIGGDAIKDALALKKRLED
ncbi:MAG TPA: DUF72 domain-containing protein [Sphingomicrobium sp.]